MIDAVRIEQHVAVPLAVIRRRVSASELSRVVPECCGLVWNAVRAQQARGGLHVAHDAIWEWSRANARRLSGPRWEIYGHWQQEWNSNPSLIRTDVYYLLRP